MEKRKTARRWRQSKEAALKTSGDGNSKTTQFNIPCDLSLSSVESQCPVVWTCRFGTAPALCLTLRESACLQPTNFKSSTI